MADPNKDEDQPNESADPSADQTAPPAADGGSAVQTAADGVKDGQIDQSDIEKLLDQAAQSLEQANGDGVDPAGEAKPFTFGDLESSPAASDSQSIDLIGEVEMDLRIELGRTQMKLQDVLQLRSGSVVALDKLAGDPVDVFANGRLIARGEVLVMNDNFCVRITELVGAG